MFERKIELPTTLDGFDHLVDQVMQKHKLTDKHHAAAIISVAIRHLPNDKATTTINYLGQSVKKNLANYVANHKASELKHAAEINQLADLLAVDPNNMQARDGLQKAANEGSKQALDALIKLKLAEEPANLENVLPITGSNVGNTQT